ncbi:MerR family transcriptional regulator, partial [Vibrio parahaemolyticus]
MTGVEVHTLRYWEREFAEFLQPVRTPGGQRRYSPNDLKVLFAIRRLLRDVQHRGSSALAPEAHRERAMSQSSRETAVFEAQNLLEANQYEPAEIVLT